MNTENEAAITEIVGSIRRLVRAVYQDTSKVSRGFGLTGSQSGVLRSLANYGPLSSAELSRKLFVTPANITGIIDRLEKKGFVNRVRKEGDRRVALIILTSPGEELAKDLPDPVERKLVSGLDGLDREQVSGLKAALDQVLHMIDARDIPDTPLELDKDQISSNS